MTKIIKLFNIFTTLFTVAILIIAGTLVVPRAFNINPYIVMSGSMEPLIKTGGIAYIDENDTKVSVGDVVTFRLSNDEIVTHRIDSIDENGNFITKGDANDVTDANPVGQSQIIGKYKYSIPYLGYVMEKKEKVIPLTIIWIFALNFISIMLSRAYSEDDTDSDNTDK